MTFAEMLEEYEYASYSCGLDDAELGASEDDRDEAKWILVAILSHEAALRERIAELEKQVAEWRELQQMTAGVAQGYMSGRL